MHGTTAVVFQKVIFNIIFLTENNECLTKNIFIMKHTFTNLLTRLCANTPPCFGKRSSQNQTNDTQSRENRIERNTM